MSADSLAAHGADPVAAAVGALGLLLLAGKTGGELATRLKQPAVLGELFAGVVLGNLAFGGIAPFQGIAENHGGTIAVESVVGSGTTFTLRLPVVTVTED